MAWLANHALHPAAGRGALLLRARRGSAPAAGERGRCADASARRAEGRTLSSQTAALVTGRRLRAPWEPLTGPAAPGSRRIGAAA